MAKISARGAHEVTRVVVPWGAMYLLRSDGKVLRKFDPKDRWRVVCRWCGTREQFVERFGVAAEKADATFRTFGN